MGLLFSASIALPICISQRNGTTIRLLSVLEPMKGGRGRGRGFGRSRTWIIRRYESAPSIIWH